MRPHCLPVARAIVLPKDDLAIFVMPEADEWFGYEAGDRFSQADGDRGRAPFARNSGGCSRDDRLVLGFLPFPCRGAGVRHRRPHDARDLAPQPQLPLAGLLERIGGA